MTESLSSTLTEPERALEKSSKTDGRPLEGVAVQGACASTARPAPVGETGLLKVRGAQMCLGYYKRPDMEPFDAEGWFDTGDLAYMDDEGYIRINGRIKDVIIRGGENVPIVEIENLLFKHPAVLSAALVGYPDPRLGERACAFVVLRAGPCARSRRPCRPTWPSTRSPNNIGPSGSRSSPTCRRRRRARCRSSSCANRRRRSATWPRRASA